MVREGAAVIDVGINYVQDPTTGKTKLVGDVDFEGKNTSLLISEGNTSFPTFILVYFWEFHTNTVFTQFPPFSPPPALSVFPHSLSSFWSHFYDYYCYTCIHTQICICTTYQARLVVLLMYICLGLVTWDWIIWREVVPVEDWFSLSEQPFVYCL